MTNLILGVTGSVASIKTHLLLEQFLNCPGNMKFEIKLLATEHAQKFFDPCIWEKYSNLIIDTDKIFEVEKIILWADVICIAPLDANTLAKIANGLCDNALTLLIKSWPYKIKPMYIAPAMNTKMWEHPFTSKHLIICETLGIKEIPPIEKNLMCGVTGIGAMAEPKDILAFILNDINFKNK